MASLSGFLHKILSNALSLIQQLEQFANTSKADFSRHSLHNLEEDFTAEWYLKRTIDLTDLVYTYHHSNQNQRGFPQVVHGLRDSWQFHPFWSTTLSLGRVTEENRSQ